MIDWIWSSLLVRIRVWSSKESKNLLINKNRMSCSNSRQIKVTLEHLPLPIHNSLIDMCFMEYNSVYGTLKFVLSVTFELTHLRTTCTAVNV